MPDYCRVQETNEINNEKEVSVRLTQMIQAIRGPQLQQFQAIPIARVS